MIAIYSMITACLVASLVYAVRSVITLIVRVRRVQQRYDETESNILSQLGSSFDGLEINDLWSRTPRVVNTPNGTAYDPSLFASEEGDDAKDDIRRLRDVYAGFVKDYGGCYDDVKNPNTLATSKDNYPDDDESDQNADISKCTRYATRPV